MADRFFFVHIQKTAGTTLREHLLANFDRSEVYPPVVGGDLGAYLTTYLDGRLLVDLEPEEQARYRLFHGHFPYSVVDLLALDRRPVTLTLLREPVARSVSVLQQKRRNQERFADASLEEIYDDDDIRLGQIVDHQTKIFSSPAAAGLSGFAHHRVGPDELAVAKRNLEQVDVVGLQGDLGGFLAVLNHRFGWSHADLGTRKNVGSGPTPGPELLERIRADNVHDIAFHEFAQELVAERSH